MGATYSKEKIFWVQAEFLNTLLLLAATYPEDPRNYFEQFVRQWTFIKTRMIDTENRGWRYQALEPGAAEHRNKGGQWMTSYHTGRALMNCEETLQRMREQGASPENGKASAQKH